MKKSILAVSIAALALGVVGAQQTPTQNQTQPLQTQIEDGAQQPLAVQARVGQTVYVETRQSIDTGDLSPQVELVAVRTSDSNLRSDRFQVLDEGLTDGINVYVASTTTTAVEVPQPEFVQNTIYTNYRNNTYGINIPANMAPGQYNLNVEVLDSSTGQTFMVPLTLQVTA